MSSTTSKHDEAEAEAAAPASPQAEGSATAQRASAERDEQSSGGDDEAEGQEGQEEEQSGDEDEEGEDEERDSDKENSQDQAKEGTQPPLPAEAAPADGQPHAWQAVWAPQQGAYYFWNAKTGETTWTNPLAPAASSSAAGPSTASTAAAAQPMSDEDFALQHGIDPDLAFLDPHLYAARLASAKGSASASQPYGASGAFDTRTGKFVPSTAVASGHDPSRLSQVARASRQMEVFFDVKAYEAERAKEREKEAMGGDTKRQKLSKKELAAYKDKKKEKRLKKWQES